VPFFILRAGHYLLSFARSTEILLVSQAVQPI
jgi:hypothetical protein